MITPSTRAAQLEQLIKLAYGDNHDLQCRLLNFRTEPLDTDMALRLLDVIGPYNAFDPDKVKRAIRFCRIMGIERFELGREHSPVIYVTLPSSREADISGPIIEAFREVDADEIGRWDGSVYDDSGSRIRAWWD